MRILSSLIVLGLWISKTVVQGRSEEPQSPADVVSSSHDPNPNSSEDKNVNSATKPTSNLERSLQLLSVPFRINCGGGAYTSGDLAYQADDYYASGWILNSPSIEVSNTNDPTIYRSYRYSGLSDSGVSYDFPLSNGNYVVVFHFAELVYNAAGQRQFDVRVENLDGVVWDNLDVFAEAGGKNLPLRKSHQTLVSDGLLSLRFDSVVSYAMVSAIEVLPAEPAPAPAPAPSPAPTDPPVTPPTVAVPTPTPPTVELPPFDPILVNVGGGYFTDFLSRDWDADFLYAFGGQTYSEVNEISGTEDDFLYTSERYGNFYYKFELPVGDYEVVIHFAETFFSSAGQRVFDIRMQNQTAFNNVDILVLTGGVKNQAVTLESTQVVSDGILVIEFVKLANSGVPKACGIEVDLIGPHLAHAVAGGPYIAVAPVLEDGSDGMAVIPVDGQTSHTHGPGLRLIEWLWKVSNEVVGTGEQPELMLPPGEHIVTLFVKDDDGNENAETTTITVLSSEHPTIQSLSPSSGDIAGGDLITITGSGFTYAASETVVHIGDLNLSDPDITVVDANTITVVSSVATIATPHPVAVSTPLGKSNALDFTYIDGAPIAFTTKKVTDLYSPTTVAFGPDEKLYVGTGDGWIYKLTLDENFNIVNSMSSSVLQDPSGDLRTILGLVFDPLDTSSTPSVYVSHTHSFHGESVSSSGLAINGKVSVVSGANLDQIDDVVAGLPASDHDHVVNGIEFGDVSNPLGSACDLLCRIRIFSKPFFFDVFLARF